jgi:hypothetical protein
MLKKKYLRSQTITHVQKKPGNSQFWSGLMKVKNSFLSLGHFKLNNGMNIGFWEDMWLGNFTLQQQYPSLYTITCWKNVSVASIFGTIPINISFRRGLVGNNLTLWHRLVARMAHSRLNDEKDKFIWDLLQNDLFSVNSMYKAFITDTLM